MTKRTYPNSSVQATQLKKVRGGTATCNHCGEIIKPKENIVRVTTRVSWFRGDDDVETHHPRCWHIVREKVDFRDVYGRLT